nr:MAG TPA: hypothetical protein [Inoviridae sp.]
MEERKEKRHLQGMRNVLLAFAFCFVCALFVGVSPVYAAKQECDYKITEADQDFIVWAKDNIFKKDNIKQYVYVRSMGDAWSVVSSDKPLKKVYIRDCWFDLIETGVTYGSAIIKGGDGSYYYHTNFSYATAKEDMYVSYFGNELIWSNYDVKGGTAKVVDNKWVCDSTDTVFFSQPLNWTDSIKEIPKVVRIQAREIIPVVVSCLALSIGCLTLLPRLKVFLH